MTAPLTSLHAGSGETSPTLKPFTDGPTANLVARLYEIAEERERRAERAGRAMPMDAFEFSRDAIAIREIARRVLASEDALHFAQTFAPPNALGAHTMAGLLEGAREYRDRLQVVESALRAASDREAALRAELMRANDRANLWSMFASSAAIALEPLGHAYEFDDPDSLSGAITRLIQRVSALSSDEQTNG